MKYICVFCGSSTGNCPIYTQAARAMGKAIARQRLGLVYGGSFDDTFLKFLLKFV